MIVYVPLTACWQSIGNWLFIHLIQYFNKSAKKHKWSLGLSPASRLSKQPNREHRENEISMEKIQWKLMFHFMWWEFVPKHLWTVCKNAHCTDTHKHLARKTSCNENVRQQLIIFFNCRNYFSLYFQVDYILCVFATSANTITPEKYEIYVGPNHKFMRAALWKQMNKKKANACQRLNFLFVQTEHLWWGPYVSVDAVIAVAFGLIKYFWINWNGCL